MVVGFTLTHMFKYPVEAVTNAYKHLHEMQNDISIKDEETIQGDSSMSCTKRTVTMLNPFPTFFQRIKLLKRTTVDFLEDTWIQECERRAWIRSRNLTWENEISIGSVVYVCPSENDQNWSTWEDTTALDFEHCGKFGILLEMYLKRKLESTNMQKIKMMENILDEMIDGEIVI